MAVNAIGIRERERAEIERSAVEALRTHSDVLPYGEEIFQRYLFPPADTCYPLEYSYHLLGDVRGKQILDFGCGSGENLPLLSRLGAKVWAIDISEQLLNIAKRRLHANGFTTDVNFIVASAYDIPLPDESVDVVFGMAILHHLELPLAAREVKRVLRKGGRAIFKEPVRNSRILKFVRQLIPYRSAEISPFERPLTDKELKNFAEGFSGYTSKAFSLPYVSLSEILPFVRKHQAYLYRMDKKMLERSPFLSRYATVRVIEMIK